MKNLVFVAHSEPVTLYGLASLINSHLCFRVCGSARTAAEVWAGCESECPSAVIVDSALEGGGGMVVRELTRRAPYTKVVVYSGDSDVLSVQRAFAAGAHGYVTRHDQTVDVTLTIVRVLEGVRHFSPQVARSFSEVMATGSMDLAKCPESVLSDRELQIYRLLGRGRSRRDLAAELNLSPKTVETHEHRIKAKLHVRTCADLTRLATAFCDQAMTQGA